MIDLTVGPLPTDSLKGGLSPTTHCGLNRVGKHLITQKKVLSL